MTDVVQTEDRGAVRIVAINRPESRNAINTTVLIELRKAIRAAAKSEVLARLGDHRAGRGFLRRCRCEGMGRSQPRHQSPSRP